MSDNHNNNNNNNRNNCSSPRKKRRWYYRGPKPSQKNNTGLPPSSQPLPPPPPPPPPQPTHQDNAKMREQDRIENDKQVSKMEQQLHDYFHKTKTAYSFIDDNGIYKFTPTPPPASSSPSSSLSNPFMNMTFTPFIPSTASLFSTPLTSNQLFPNLWTHPIFPATAATAAPIPTPTPPLQIIEVREDIKHIDDLIALCDKYPLSDTKKYNINMTAIHAIREPLCDLSKMIGMETIKRNIVDQILYYLQDLHIPETKNKNNNKPDKPTPAELEPPNKNIFNPFASTFPGFPAVATADFKPLAAKLPPWNPSSGTTTDDFALPTKGDFMHTVIYGPPGSGKTEVAKIIGRIFSNLGILNKKIFKKVSRNDLVAGYLGQTAIKTKEMIKASLGGVLFIDEAYSLGNSEKRDSFAKECVDTLCEALSEHKHNWMVIIAGYEKELNDCFFSLNEGLNSRFTWRFKLDPYKPGELQSIYNKQVLEYGWTIAKGENINETPESWFASRMEYFTTYGRDMETLFTKTKIAHSRRVFCLPQSEKKIITTADLENGFKLFIENPEVKDRKERGLGPYMKTLYL
jgi:hypothetical protein